MTSKIPNSPPDNIFAIDLTPYKAFLVDLPQGATKGMRTEKEGWDHARAEILTNQATYGDRAGITATDYGRFLVLDQQHAQIRTTLPRVSKAAEVLRESVAHIDNQRHKLITQFANAAENHAAAEGRDPTLLTAYEKSIAYRGVIANKAVKKRHQNEEAKATTGGESTSDPAVPATPAAPPSPQTGKAPAPASAPIRVSRTPNTPPDSIFAIDLTPLKPFLVDLPPGAMKGMRTEQDGYHDVREEIVANQAKHGDRAGITTTDFQRFVALNGQYDQLLPLLPVVEKAEEVLSESLAHIDDQRHKLVKQFADAAEEHADAEGGDATLLTAYEKTIAYRGVTANKAVKARQKKEEK